MYVRFLTILVFLLLAGCQSQLAAIKPPLDEEGELFLYVQPFPRESDRLGFTLETVSAIRDDGVEFPLELSLHDISGKNMNRQRFLASGNLAPGSYRGLALRASKPRLQTEEASAALLTGSDATVLEFPFTIQRQQAGLLTLTFDYAKAVRQGFAFAPIFTIRSPGKPVSGLTGYVTNSGDNTITVFDKQYRQVVAVIATGKEPRGVVFDQQRKRAYVALAGEDAVAVIDITTGEEIRRIRLVNGDAPLELALTPDGKTLLAVDAGSNMVSVIDPLSFLELARVSVDDGPSAVLIDPAGLKAYIFNSLAATLSVIDIPRRNVIATIASEAGASRGGFNRAGDRLYTIHELSSYLTILNPTTMSVQQRLYVGMGMISMKVDPLTDLVYAGKKHDAWAEVYEPFSFNTLATIGTGGSATYMTIDGEENKLVVVNAPRHTLQIINLVNYKVEAELDVGAEPYRVALMGER
ncbi:MAG: hypothetical protein PHR66_09705 [Desulfuromonadaceae bacterium]|nr:hypothetical protein [Desulfuromonadaceae bacterium]